MKDFVFKVLVCIGVYALGMGLVNTLCEKFGNRYNEIPIGEDREEE